jgi:hypothetical protein
MRFRRNQMGFGGTHDGPNREANKGIGANTKLATGNAVAAVHS